MGLSGSKDDALIFLERFITCPLELEMAAAAVPEKVLAADDGDSKIHVLQILESMSMLHSLASFCR